MKAEECNSFSTCGATICPLDDYVNDAEWFSSEGICTQYSYPWIKAQRKISKKAKDNKTYFTLKMLERNCIIKSGIIGLDPEKDKIEELKKWMKKHPVKRELTEEEKNKLRDRMNTARMFKGSQNN